jgi:hypothetical protein
MSTNAVSITRTNRRTTRPCNGQSCNSIGRAISGEATGGMIRLVAVTRCNSFYSKLPCHPVYRSRIATPQGARPDAVSSRRRAPIRQDCIEMLAKSEVVTVCS